MKQIYNLRRIALLMAIFLIGFIASGHYPTWLKLGFPGACVLWLAVYDDAKIATFEKGVDDGTTNIVRK